MPYNINPNEHLDRFKRKVAAAVNDLETEVDGVEGLPSGGTTNQVLTKSSGTDYDADWEDVPAATAYPQAESDATTAYTLVLADAGGVVEMTNGSANTVTVPPNASVAFAVNTRIDVVQYGSGTTTIAAGAGVTLRGDLEVPAQYAGVSLWKRGTNEWVVFGGTT